MWKSLAVERTNPLGNKTYFLEYVKLVGFFAGLFLLLSLASFRPSDSTPFSTSGEMGKILTQSQNIFGPLGASVADWSWQLFGLGAIVLVGAFCAQLLSTFQRPQMRSRVGIQLIGYPQLILSYLGLLQVLRQDWPVQGVVFRTGGVVGSWVAATAESGLGHWGALLLLSFGVVASLPLCFGIRPTEILFSVFRKFSLLDQDDAQISGQIQDSREVKSNTVSQNLVQKQTDG